VIGTLRGLLLAAGPTHVVLEAGGVGYEIEVPPSVLGRLPPPGTEVRLYTAFEMRAELPTLYGFVERRERDLFRLLRRASGIGPRLALAILAGLAPEEIEDALRRHDAAPFVRVPGIGRKTAERLVLELSGRLPEPTPEISGHDARLDALAALVHLGYRRPEAERLLAGVEPGVEDVALLVRAALRRARPAGGGGA
jgi:Holliday junction DNA helicase RuvA